MMFLVSTIAVREWIGIIASFLTVLTLALKFLSMAMKSSKLAKWAKVAKEIQGYVKTAEDYINFEGPDKKLWAMTQAQQFCIDHNIKFDIELASEIIESYVELSRQVNKREVT